jgi:hypothetical protein
MSTRFIKDFGIKLMKCRDGWSFCVGVCERLSCSRSNIAFYSSTGFSISKSAKKAITLANQSLKSSGLEKKASTIRHSSRHVFICSMASPASGEGELDHHTKTSLKVERSAGRE